MALASLPDEILIRIFSHFHNDPEEDQSFSEETLPDITLHSHDNVGNKKKDNKKKKQKRVAGPGAKMLCRLCCCSQRFNHLASADQLWKPLTLAQFPDRHWPTTDQKNLDMIQIRREHQLKLLQPYSSSLIPSPAAVTNIVVNQEGQSNRQDDDEEQGQEEGQNKKLKRTKFYSRFEQRAHRRKFASLDPTLQYTPLAWTNTLWSWKRTYFGDCRFIESKDVSTPNRIDHAVHRNNADARQECERCWRPTRSCICSALTQQLYCNCRARIMILQHPRCQVSIGTIRILKTSFKHCQIIIGKDFKAGRSTELDQALDDPNCTPLLLYPSHSAADIHTLVANESSSSSFHKNTSSRYHCQDCIHQNETIPDTTSSYPYKLIIALDGSWSHAKIMYRCNPRLQQLAQIKFPNPPQSIYHELKPEPKVTYTSTAEAVGQAVALLGWPTAAGRDVADSVATNAELLMEDLIRPLKRMIEIQDMIQETQDTPEKPTESDMAE
ncbi:hypothetical protein BGZ93_007201 [Podila epicladia]|nr:hypothetical protein BGZ92_005569 [Podila epicladia]KAG0094459.1 hypothetical protein BGZ93_007201 [Podila epicladia]